MGKIRVEILYTDHRISIVIMKIRLSDELFNKIPGLTAAVVLLKNIKNKRKSSNVGQLLRGVSAEKKRELASEVKKQGVDDLLKFTLSEGSVLGETYLLDSLLRKVAKGIEVESQNNVCDLAHYFSLKYTVPVQGQDIDMLEKDLEISFITPLKGKKAKDLQISKESTWVAFWLINIGNYSKEEFLKLAEEFAKLLKKYSEGASEAFILNKEQPEADFQYVSRKEKMYLEKLEKQAAALEKAKAQEISAVAFVKEKLRADLEKAVKVVQSALGEAQDVGTVELMIPKEKNHGDYATNAALKLGKMFQKNPQEVAQDILKNLPELPYLERAEMAGAGFINFYLSERYLRKELDEILRLKDEYGKLNLGAGKKVLIDYSSPNIAKPLGAHHLLSTLIGQALANLFRFQGYEVVGANYLGDWGTQFGKLMYAYKTWGKKEQIVQSPLNKLLKLYVRFHDEAEKDPALEEKGREEFKKLEGGDDENKKIWEWIREISLQELEKIYKLLGIQFDEYLPESMYEQPMKEILEEGKSKGIFVSGEQGALIVTFENDQYPPLLVQKSDGATLYATRDLASLKDRLERFHPTRLLYVVDVAQTLYFKQLFATAKKLGLDGAEFIHVVFGRMQFPEGKMSTRKGTVILVEELVKEAVSRTETLINEKSPAMNPEEKKVITQGIALGAIKYHIVSQNRETNLIFDWDRMLSLEGNSAPYLQYTCARAQSILRKAKEEKPQENVKQMDLFTTPAAEKNQEHPLERELLRFLAKFKDELASTTENYKPHLLTNYLYELAQIFNRFYQEVPVISASSPDLRKSRLQLTEATAQIIGSGLKLLGIEVFERM
jgi:arginyl-tRNA synthetase